MSRLLALAVFAASPTVAAEEPEDELDAMPSLGVEIDAAEDDDPDNGDGESIWQPTAEGRSWFNADFGPSATRPPVEAWLRGEIGLVGKLADRIPLKAAVRATNGRTYGDVGGRRRATESEVELGETTIAFLGDRVTATIGHQVIRWGVTDFFSPNDVVSPIDSSGGISASLGTTRRPVWALRASRVGDSSSLEVAALPFFESDIFPSIYNRFGVLGAQPRLVRVLDAVDLETRESLESDLTFAQDSSGQGRRGLSAASVGARASITRGGIDLAAQVFYGFDRLPHVTLSEPLEMAAAAAAAESPELPAALVQVAEAAAAGKRLAWSRTYRRIDVGADARWVAGRSVFRLEGGATPKGAIYRQDAGGAARYDRVPIFRWSVGAERPVLDNWTVDAAAFGTEVHVGHGERLTRATETSRNAALRLRYREPKGRIELTFTGQYNWLRRDSLAGGSAVVELNEHLDAELGFAVVSGPQDSLGGSLDEADLIFAGLTWRVL